MKKILILGGFRECHDHLLENTENEIYWLINRNYFWEGDQARKTKVTIVYSNDLADNEIAKLASSICAANNIEYIATFHDEFQLLGNKISNLANLPMFCQNDNKTISLFLNKYEMRKHLREAKFEDVIFKKIKSQNDITAVLSDHPDKKFVLKPIDGSGSRDISIIHAKKNNYSVNFDLIKIAEQYFYGEEYSVEAITFKQKHKIIAITKKYTDPETHIEIGHVVPACLPASIEEIIKNRINAFLKLMNIKNGVTHTEIKIEHNSVNVIESHTRTGGDKIPYLVKNTYGVDLWKENANFVFMHKEPELVQKNFDQIDLKIIPNLATAIFFILPKIFGEISSIAGLNDIHTMPGYVNHEFKKKIGDYISKPMHSHDRIGYVIFEGQTSDIAVLRAKNAINHITYAVG